jgi:glycosyltransferase involved in cell wall biosynthesis
LPRILHIIDSLGHNGAATQLRVLVGGLASYGYDVHVAALDDQRKKPLSFRQEFGEGSGAAIFVNKVAPLSRRWSADPLAMFRLRRLVGDLRPDIVHTWNFDSALYACAAIESPRRVLGSRARAAGLSAPRARLIVGQYRIEPWRPTWQWYVARRAADYAAKLVTNSLTVRNWYVASGFSDDKFMVIPAGVAAPVAGDVSREELLRELDLPPDAKLIGIVSRLAPDRRVQDLIWAADLLRVLHDNLRVLVIGDGSLRTQLERYARLASDLDHIRFLGERDDLWRIMPHFDVLWNGSENRGQSVAILEAMAAGVPVIASDTPINRELIVGGETGYLIPLGHRAGRAARARHTDRIFSDGELASRLSRAARQRIVENHDAQKMANQYAELYSAVLG